MECTQLILPFLGQRDYLHGTTLFEALLPLAPGDAEISFKFSQMIRSNCVSLSSEKGDVSFSWKSASAGAATIYVAALAAIEPRERRAYPEALVADRVVIAGKTASYAGESPFTFVATLIPMHKRLLAANVTPAAPGQWVFTRFDLRRRPASSGSIELRLAGVFQDQLARSTVSVAGEDLGTIYFSWLPAR